MELTIHTEQDNKLCGRKEGIAHITGVHVTPSLAEVKKLLTSHFKTSENCIDLRKVQSMFGGGPITVQYYVYHTSEHSTVFTRTPKTKKAAAPSSAGTA